MKHIDLLLGALATRSDALRDIANQWHWRDCGNGFHACEFGYTMGAANDRAKFMVYCPEEECVGYANSLNDAYMMAYDHHYRISPADRHYLEYGLPGDIETGHEAERHAYMETMAA